MVTFMAQNATSNASAVIPSQGQDAEHANTMACGVASNQVVHVSYLILRKQNKS